MTSFKEQLFAHIKKKYHASPEYPRICYPGYAVFRHSDNQKLFAHIIDVPGNKLGLESREIVNVLNVKMGEPFLADFLVQQEGFFRCYHINRGNWISILLNGEVPFDEICRWLEESYAATASKATKHKIRPSKEWIVPSNPKYYDIEVAFSETDEIDWKQGKGIKTGDTVFIYVAAPVSAILYKCRVTKTDIPYKKRYRCGNTVLFVIYYIKFLTADFISLTRAAVSLS